jgi:hypothetical protein
MESNEDGAPRAKPMGLHILNDQKLCRLLVVTGGRREKMNGN